MYERIEGISVYVSVCDDVYVCAFYGAAAAKFNKKGKQENREHQQ